MKTKSLVVIVTTIILVILLGWFLFEATHQPPILTGTSKDGKWHVTYEPEEDIDLASQNLWAVHLTWNERPKMYVKEFSFKENGVTVSSGNGKDEQVKAQKMAVAIMADQPDPAKQYEVNLLWEDNGVLKEDVIKVDHQIKRAFVLPNLIKRIFHLY
ncbi:hypothetical protein NST73_02875 [Bacillus sp. FSL W7-1034]|uniref:hypothetical protein n=1 Tax=Bacillus TaxID=1386 RepID=UPI0004650B84|nr:hypothetical protein [Bacillus altitudinis]MCY7450965.1 hypothetical protein [Bacillus altitudinis]MCY7688450.1 hypothetical protein [Bacillus altitudinis]MCY7703336.1 hypothetical protein [Bacillus altitudinis]MDR4200417.1 hypothetical protein [Bacillus altitudinis]MEC3813036.1 hypothetical protein [Bacillus altitudinis]